METVYRQICSACCANKYLGCAASSSPAPLHWMVVEFTHGIYSQVNAAVISANCMQILVHLNKRFIFASSSQLHCTKLLVMTLS